MLPHHTLYLSHGSKNSCNFGGYILELQAINSRKMRTLEEIKADWMADWMAKGMTANSSNIIPPVSSTPPPTTPQPSYTSASTKTTPPVVHRPSYASVSLQTEPLVKIPEVATPVFIIMPPSPPPIALLSSNIYAR